MKKKAQAGSAMKNAPAGAKPGSYMKSGGKMKKGGMAAFEKSSFDKKADRPGGSHGPEGSAKDIKMDKIDAKKQGYIKKNGGKMKKK
jgi:hypothetical protein